MDIAAKKYFVKVDGVLKSGMITASGSADRDSAIRCFKKCNDERLCILNPVDYMPDNHLPKCSIHLGIMGGEIFVSITDNKTGENFEYTKIIEEP